MKAGARRDKIRARARRAIQRERKRRQGERESYAFKWTRGGRGYGSRATTGRSYTRAESDSLAIHNIDPELAELFLEMRREFSYDMEPDYRAEAFAEWVEENQDDVQAWIIQRAEIDPAELVKSELAWARERDSAPVKVSRWEAERADAIPF